MGLQLRFKGDTTPVVGAGKRKSKEKSKKARSESKSQRHDEHAPSTGDSSRQEVSSWAKARDALRIVGPCVILFPDAAKPVVMNVDGTTGEGTFKVVEAAKVLSDETDLEKLALDFANSFVPGHIDNVFVVRHISKGDVKSTLDASTNAIAIRSSSTGKLLSASNSGAVSFHTEAIGPAEQWLPVYLADTGTFAIQSLNFGTYLGIEKPMEKPEKAGGYRITCDAKEVNFAQRFVVRVQPRVASKLLDVKSGGKTEQEKIDAADMYGVARAYRDVGRRVAAHVYGSEAVASRVLRGAAANGKLSETLLDLRSKSKSDKFCK